MVSIALNFIALSYCFWIVPAVASTTRVSKWIFFHRNFISKTDIYFFIKNTYKIDILIDLSKASFPKCFVSFSRLKLSLHFRKTKPAAINNTLVLFRLDIVCEKFLKFYIFCNAKFMGFHWFILVFFYCVLILGLFTVR